MPELVDVTEFEQRIDPNETTQKEYQEFRDNEGIPVHTGFYVEDLAEVQTGHWERTGQQGAFVSLYGAEGMSDIHIHELAPGGEMLLQNHLYDETVYVIEGQGATILGEGDNETIFEWSDGALFSIPGRTPYKHINQSASSARLIAQTTLPLVVYLIRDEETIFNPRFSFWDALQDEEYYSPEGGIKLDERLNRYFWDANFIPSIPSFDDFEERTDKGAARSTMRFHFSTTDLSAHISVLDAGRYLQAHRHGPGAHVLGLRGEGYSLVWQRGTDELIKVEWKPNSVFVPPTLWYHQHFSTTQGGSKFLALHGTMKMNRELGAGNVTHPFTPENLITHVEEDPIVREVYEQKIEGEGIDFVMPEECYTNPDFTFD